MQFVNDAASGYVWMFNDVHRKTQGEEERKINNFYSHKRRKKPFNTIREQKQYVPCHECGGAVDANKQPFEFILKLN